MSLNGSALQATHDDGALGQVEIIPAEVARFRNAQAVSVDQETDEPIAVTVPIALQGRKELGHLGFGQVLMHPIARVLLAA